MTDELSFQRRVDKVCQYGCGKELFWDKTEPGKLKWVECESGILHDYKRCAELLKREGKKLVK